MEALFDGLVALSHRAVMIAFTGLWLGALLGATMWVLRRGIRNLNAATGYVAWWVVLVAVIVVPLTIHGPSGDSEPVSFSQGTTAERSRAIPLGPVAQTQPVTDPVMETALTDSRVRTRTERSSPGETALTVGGVSHSGTQHTDAVLQAGSRGAELTVAEVAGRLLPISFIALWVLVAGALLCRVFWSWFQLRRVKSQSQDITEDHTGELSHLLAAAAGRRAIRIGVSTQLNCPVAAGLGAPRILIPRNLIDWLTRSELEAVIRHERAHLHRYDDWTTLAQRLIEAIFFFNPAVLWIGRQLNLDREMACDDHVVARSGHPVAYARCLSRLAHAVSRPDSSLIPGVLTGRKQIFRRFERLLDGRSSWAVKVCRSRFACITAAIIAVTVLAAEIAPLTALALEPVTWSQVDQALNKKTSRRAKKDRRPVSAPRADEPVSGIASTPQVASSAAMRADEVSAAAPVVPRADAVIPARGVDRMAATESVAPVGIGTSSVPRADAAAPVTDAEPVLAGVGIGPEPTIEAVGQITGGLLSVVDFFDDPWKISGNGIFSSVEHDGESNISWSDGHDKVQVRYEGDIVFSDDDRRIESISRRGYFSLWVKQDGERYELHVEPRRGELEYDFEVNGRNREFAGEGERWLADILIDVLRRTGIGAETRAMRILRNDGVDGVLDEVEDIESDFVARVYLSVLLAEGKLTESEYAQVLDYVSVRIESDYEKGQILLAMADEVKDAPGLSDDYVGVVATMESDFEARRALSAVSIGDDADPEVIAEVLRIAGDMDSDFEKTELLIEIADNVQAYPDLIDAYVQALRTTDSDFEARRALMAVSIGRHSSEAIIKAVLGIATRMDSDFERAELLTEIAPQCRKSTALQKAYVAAAVDMDSDFEARRALEALRLGRDADPQVTAAVAQVAADFDSDFEKTELLIVSISAACSDANALETYLTAARSIESNFEKSRALQHLIGECDLDEAGLLGVLGVAATIDSDFEQATVLKLIADDCRGNADLEDAYLEIIDDMSSDYEADETYKKLFPRKRARRDRR